MDLLAMGHPPWAPKILVGGRLIMLFRSNGNCRLLIADGKFRHFEVGDFNFASGAEV